MARKKTLGSRIGKFIDYSLDGLTGMATTVINVPGDILKGISAENQRIVESGRILRETKGSLWNIKADNSARLKREELPPEVLDMLKKMRER